MPTTVPRRTKSRRLIFPALYWSIRWFSISLRSLRISSTRRWVSSTSALLPAQLVAEAAVIARLPQGVESSAADVLRHSR